MKVIKINTPVLAKKIRIIVNDGKTSVTMQTTGNWEYKFFKAIIEGTLQAKKSRTPRNRLAVPESQGAPANGKE